jgi:hypothetical protein
MIFGLQGSLNWTAPGGINEKWSERNCRSDQVDRRYPVQRVDLLVRGKSDRVVGVAHHGKQPLEGGLRETCG